MLIQSTKWNKERARLANFQMSKEQVEHSVHARKSQPLSYMNSFVLTPNPSTLEACLRMTGREKHVGRNKTCYDLASIWGSGEFVESKRF